MVPRPGEYLSFLMGAPAISDDALAELGVEVVERIGAGVRGLRVPEDAREAYTRLIREQLDPGFWNELVGRERILFVFKLADGSVEQLEDAPATRARIAALCSRLNGDPLERTSDLLTYLAANRFYRAVMRECYGVQVA